MFDFKLPSLGADMDEGTLLRWQVQPGDVVHKGQVVAVVDTSKAAVDVEIWQEGTVHQLLVPPGTKIPVGTVLATLLAPGEAASASTGPGKKTAAKAAPKTSAPVPAPAPAATAPVPPAPAARLRSSPAARQRAAALGVDLNRIAGTGAHGAITLADVEQAALAATSARAAAAAQPPTPADAAHEARLAQVRQQEMRRAIAAAMGRSKREIPHYYLQEPIALEPALRWLAQANAGRPITSRLLLAVLQLKAVAQALRKFPEFNGFYRDDQFQPASAVHMGVAISLRQGGLVAPALLDAGSKPLDQLMQELNDLVRRARAGSLRSSEMSEPTITVTNLGEQGVESVFGVIYPPQVALVGFGRVSERPWVTNGQLGAMPAVVATLSADHRVSDGHRGALFLAELREWLQRPQDL